MIRVVVEAPTGPFVVELTDAATGVAVLVTGPGEEPCVITGPGARLAAETVVHLLKFCEEVTR